MTMITDCFDKIMNDKISGIADTLSPVVEREPVSNAPIASNYDMVYTVPDYSSATLISDSPTYQENKGYFIEFISDFDGYVVINYSNTNMTDSNMNTGTRMVVLINDIRVREIFLRYNLNSCMVPIKKSDKFKVQVPWIGGNNGITYLKVYKVPFAYERNTIEADITQQAIETIADNTITSEEISYPSFQLANSTYTNVYTGRLLVNSKSHTYYKIITFDNLPEDYSNNFAVFTSIGPDNSVSDVTNATKYDEYNMYIRYYMKKGNSNWIVLDLKPIRTNWNSKLLHNFTKDMQLQVILYPWVASQNKYMFSINNTSLHVSCIPYKTNTITSTYINR